MNCCSLFGSMGMTQKLQHRRISRGCCWTTTILCCCSISMLIAQFRYGKALRDAGCAFAISTCSSSRHKGSKHAFSSSSAEAAKSSMILPASAMPSTASSEQRPFFPIYYNDVYDFPLPPNHRFPMDKYRKVRELVQQGILNYGTNNKHANVDCEFRVSPLATFEELTLTHSPDYVRRFLDGDLSKDELRNVGFPWSPSGVDRARSSVGGTVAAAVAVCEDWSKRLAVTATTRSGAEAGHGNRHQKILAPCWGAHVAGGTHHAFYDRGEGFCVFSDIAVAADVILRRFPDLVRRILILDLDVHQGNGNAVLFHGRPEVFTFSMHCNANYFSDKQASDLDIELPANCNDETYLLTLRHWLKRIREDAGDFDFIFFQAGVDILENDRLGRMRVSGAGVRRRNELVFQFAAREMKNLPLVITMGGGYPRNNEDWSPILDAHASVYLQAYDFLASLE